MSEAQSAEDAPLPEMHVKLAGELQDSFSPAETADTTVPTDTEVAEAAVAAAEAEAAREKKGRWSRNNTAAPALHYRGPPAFQPLFVPTGLVANPFLVQPPPEPIVLKPRPTHLFTDNNGNHKQFGSALSLLSARFIQMILVSTRTECTYTMFESENINKTR